MGTYRKQRRKAIARRKALSVLRTIGTWILYLVGGIISAGFLFWLLFLAPIEWAM